MSTPQPEVGASTARILAAFEDVEAPLIEILHAVQRELGCVPEEAQRLIAHGLNLSRAEVHGVVSFYHDFREAPAGRHVLKICRAEACQSMGGEALAETASDTLGVEFGGTTRDGAVTLEAVYCLGQCACAPAAMIDNRLVARLDRHRLEALLAEARQ